jgi:hypothetical protein
MLSITCRAKTGGVQSRAGEETVEAFLLLIIGTALVVVVLTLRLAWREHRDRRLGSRLGYSWGASFADIERAARTAEREADPLRMAGPF